MIFINGNIYTMDEKRTIAQAVKTQKDKILIVGSNEEVLSYREEGEEVIDLQGKTMVPGFNDSHMHLINYGNMLTKVDLVGTDSIDDINNRIIEYIGDNKIQEGKWVLGRGWNQDYFTREKVFPSRYDLDRASKDNPIIITRACGHVAVVNSKALELLDIDKNTPQVPGGEFELDNEGEPTGVFNERAMDLIYKYIDNPNVEDIKKMIVNAVKDLNKEGITSVGADDFGLLPSRDFEQIFQAYKELIQEDNLNIRIYEQCRISNMEVLQEFFDKGYKTGWGDNRFKVGPIKIFMDGSLGARTAALNEPYKDDEHTKGVITLTQEELDNLVELSHLNDTHVAVHAIGDRAMDMSFDSIEKALDKKPVADHRHGIVHCQITDEDLLNRFKELNAIAHIQPIFLDYDWKIVRDRVGKDREKTSYNWKTMVDKGIAIACGSDAPVEIFNVYKGIYEAVVRKDLDGNPEGGWLIEQALTVDEALYGYTMGGAYASFEEEVKGSIEQGKLADMVVLSQDIFNAPEDRIKDIYTTMTVFNGNIVYQVLE